MYLSIYISAGITAISYIYFSENGLSEQCNAVTHFLLPAFYERATCKSKFRITVYQTKDHYMLCTSASNSAHLVKEREKEVIKICAKIRSKPADWIT